VSIRTFRAGDEAQQAAVYNAAAGGLPGFKPANEDEVRRRTRARDFDPESRFYAEEGGKVVGYAVLNPNGRVSVPWCLPGHESWADPLFERVVAGLKQRGIARAYAAYRADWPAAAEFLTKRGFAKARDVVNFVLDMTDLPTMAARPTMPVAPLEKADLPAVAEIGRGIIRLPADQLERYFFANPYFPAEAFFVMRSKADNSPVAVGVALEDERYADPHKVDANMPCYRLGAFGTEGMNTKRVNGLFSILIKAGQNFMPVALDLLGQAASRLDGGSVAALAAQVPSDAPQLLRFYQSYFRRQGAFPVFERTLG
jgi:hypothetical protein